MRRVLVLILAAAAVAALAAGAEAAPAVSYGLQDDAWIEFGPGTLESRIATLQELGLKVVRVTVHWDAAEPSPGEYDWSRTDALLEPLEAAGIDPVVTLYGTPEWANGGRDVNV